MDETEWTSERDSFVDICTYYKAHLVTISMKIYVILSKTLEIRLIMFGDKGFHFYTD